MRRIGKSINAKKNVILPPLSPWRWQLLPLSVVKRQDEDRAFQFVSRVLATNNSQQNPQIVQAQLINHQHLVNTTLPSHKHVIKTLRKRCFLDDGNTVYIRKDKVAVILILLCAQMDIRQGITEAAGCIKHFFDESRDKHKLIVNPSKWAEQQVDWPMARFILLEKKLHTKVNRATGRQKISVQKQIMQTLPARKDIPFQYLPMVSVFMSYDVRQANSVFQPVSNPDWREVILALSDVKWEAKYTSSNIVLKHEDLLTLTTNRQVNGSVVQ